MILSLIALAALKPGAISDSVFSGNPAFQTSYSGKARLQSVEKVLAQFSESTGQRLSAAKPFDDLKVTYAVNERPLAWLLDRIADTLDLTWKKQGSDFVLDSSPEAKKALTETQATLDRAARADFQEHLGRLKTAARLNFHTEADIFAKLNQSIDAELEARKPGWSERVRSLREEVSARYLLRGPADYLVGRLIIRGALGPFNAQSKVFAASTSGFPGVASLSQYELAGLFDQPVGDAFLAVRYDADSIDYNLISSSSSTPVSDSGGWSGDFGFSEQPPNRRFIDWASSPQVVADSLKGKIVSPLSLPKSRSEATVSDALFAAAADCGMDLVADAFAVSYPLQGSAEPAEQFWTRFGRPENYQGSVRIVDNAILFRHSGFWDLRRQEVPDRLVETTVDAWNREGKLSTRLQAEFVNQLTNRQRAWLPQIADGRLPFSRIGQSLFYLDLWNSIPDLPRANLMEHRLIPIRELPRTMTLALRELVISNLAKGRVQFSGSGSKLFSSLFGARFDEFSMLWEPLTRRFEAHSDGNVRVEIPVEQLVADPKAVQTDRLIQLYFGLSATESIVAQGFEILGPPK